ncbi:MAG TPA: carboxypeptidase-like regulatory domain-containing protein, partial [Polyangia bacterium]|nr:carboxypeptidase-like regulatory domain-containing protein [Polyangia bacterium]
MEFASHRSRVFAAVASVAFLATGACRKSAPTAHERSSATFALAGRVTDEADHAVPSARVHLLPDGDGGASLPREAVADLAGRFSFEGLVAGRYALLVEAVGLASIEPPPISVPGAPPTVRLAGQGRALSGNVAASGAPTAGARVRLGDVEGGPARETLSDREGHFVFHGLGAGVYSLRATRGNLASPILRGVATDGAPGRAAPLLALGPGLGVEGQIVDDGGRGAPEADVRAESTPDDPLAEAAVTSSDGHFRLGPLPPGRYRLVARATGYLLRAPLAVALSADSVTPPQRLELVRGAAIEGRVADARGAPIAGARIWCGGGGAGASDLVVIYDALPLAAEAAASGAGAGHSLGAAHATRTDARGAFRVDDLLPGPTHLEIARAPFAPLVTDTWTLAPGERRDVGALTMLDAASPTNVQIGADAGAPARRSADATLVGIARDSSNRPLARARVRAFLPPAATSPGPPPAEAIALASAVTDAGGHFTLTHVPGAPLLLELDHADYPATYATAAPGALVELAVPIPGGVDGEVRERATGAVVPGWRLEATGPDGQHASVGGA